MAGRNYTVPPLGSVTTEFDEIKIAKKWLRKPLGLSNSCLVTRFEREFARWNGTQNAFAFMSGRAALSACISALGLGKGDKAIVPGYTCIVVPNAFRFAGVDISFCDIETDTYGPCYESIVDRVDNRTKVIVIHHLYGIVCRDYEKILNFAHKKSIAVIEDCCQSMGATYQGIKIGNFGTLSFFSFEQSKVISTFNGGMAVTNDPGLASKLKIYQEQMDFPSAERTKILLNSLLYNYYLQKFPFRHLIRGSIDIWFQNRVTMSTTSEEVAGKKPSHYGQRMSAPFAEIGLKQLQKIDRYNERRRLGAQIWNGWCKKNGFQVPLIIKNSVPVYLRYPVLVKPEMKKDCAWAQSLKVPIGTWFESNLHPSQGQRVAGCPIADEVVQCCINFPTVL